MFFTHPLAFSRFTKVQKKDVSSGGFQMVKVLSQAHSGKEQLILYHHLWESSKNIDMSLLNCQKQKTKKPIRRLL